MEHGGLRYQTRQHFGGKKSNYLANAGCLRPLKRIEDKDLLVEDIMFQVVHQVNGALQRFREGMKTLGNSSLKFDCQQWAATKEGQRNVWLHFGGTTSWMFRNKRDPLGVSWPLQREQMIFHPWASAHDLQWDLVRNDFRELLNAITTPVIKPQPSNQSLPDRPFTQVISTTALEAQSAYLSLVLFPILPLTCLPTLSPRGYPAPASLICFLFNKPQYLF
ncbi:hypothetical protein PFLUV_G00116270 [Perca fluviatilis]|uniref:Uncharacterized protein n=1 Tax=Perca fluviatilis TaxID=8168 RepID=A0A6A5EYX6_PERFL|nr:hypothetical protein PFLUV_G00116270 [Perca fluviatilis]